MEGTVDGGEEVTMTFEGAVDVEAVIETDSDADTLEGLPGVAAVEEDFTVAPAAEDPQDKAETRFTAVSRVVPVVQAWRACSMLIAAEIQRSSTRNRQAWNSAECDLMPH